MCRWRGGGSRRLRRPARRAKRVQAGKFCRVLGNLCDLPGFAYESSEAVRAHLASQIESVAGSAVPSQLLTQHQPPIAAIKDAAHIDTGELDIPMYDIDAVLRRSPALQATSTARRARGEL